MAIYSRGRPSSVAMLPTNRAARHMAVKIPSAAQALRRTRSLAPPSRSYKKPRSAPKRKNHPASFNCINAGSAII